MRAAYEVVEPHEGGSLRCWRATGERFNGPWHFHPEIEIMLVERSRGLRFVGDSVEPFREGDLVMVGPNLPHVWVNRNVPTPAPHDHAIAICVQFRQDFLGADLWRAPEFAGIATLFRRSVLGLHFAGPDARAAVAHLRRIVRTVGAPRLAELILLLNLLGHSAAAKPLSGSGYVPNLRRQDAARVDAVCRYVHDNLAATISQPAAARLAGLGPSAFSHFFHEKMGRTFSAYVNQLRVARAIHFMVEDNMGVSEAAFASGFNNLSNFNHHFRTLKGMSPRAFLHHFRASDGVGQEWLVRGAWIR
ncbi:MAG TPA: AraC family transcriptional regulator [Opitutus sp.]|nr:AraC family transcriptional regulator [Opitutus sp.]